MFLQRTSQSNNAIRHHFDDNERCLRSMQTISYYNNLIKNRIRFLFDTSLIQSGGGVEGEGGGGGNKPRPSQYHIEPHFPRERSLSVYGTTNRSKQENRPITYQDRRIYRSTYLSNTVSTDLCLQLLTDTSSVSLLLHPGTKHYAEPA